MIVSMISHIDGVLMFDQSMFYLGCLSINLLEHKSDYGMQAVIGE